MLMKDYAREHREGIDIFRFVENIDSEEHTFSNMPENFLCIG